MKKLVVGLILTLSFGLVGCTDNKEDSSVNNELVLNETEVIKIIDNKKCTGEEYDLLIKYFADKMNTAQSEYFKLIEKNKSKEDISKAMKDIYKGRNEYRDILIEVGNSIDSMVLMKVSDKEWSDYKDKYFLLRDLKKDYSTSLDYEIEYTRSQDETLLDNAKEELAKAIEKYNKLNELVK